ncbi:Protein fam49b [Cichlidogyrus casuarinus]|uniref:Protein fam49b n=1 Tax=Cichlidogyrus casuarinus TaxID=1844966 RepID=A0ABD2QHS5_9PLAT
MQDGNSIECFSAMNGLACNELSLFYGNSTPMLLLVIENTRNWRDSNGNPINFERLKEFLASIAHVSCCILKEKHPRIKMTCLETRLLCLRVMTGVIILYDSFEEDGVCSKYSKLDVKSCLEVLRDSNGSRDVDEAVSSLLNAIRNTVVSTRRELPPRKIHQLLTMAY